MVMICFLSITTPNTHIHFSSKEQQRSVKMMSIWEQRANQLRRQNRASCEALYSELEPEERLRLSTALHIRPDMKTHHDRPLLVEPRDGPLLASHQHHYHKPCVQQEVVVDSSPVPYQSRRHHRQSDKNQAKIKDDNGGCAKKGRHHVHHSRFKDHISQGKEGKSERSHSRDGGRKHYHQSLLDEAGGLTNENDHRHHHSHQQSRGGNGTVNIGGSRERRARHKDRCSSNRDGDRHSRGDCGANGERRRHRTHGSKGQFIVEGEDSNERGKLHNHR